MNIKESKLHFDRHCPSNSEMKQRNNELQCNASCLLEHLKCEHAESKIKKN